MIGSGDGVQGDVTFHSKQAAISQLKSGIDIAHRVRTEQYSNDISCIDTEKFVFEEDKYSQFASGRRHKSSELIVLRYCEKTEGHWEVLLNLRSDHVKFHAGMVCLPGGKPDTGEDNSLVLYYVRLV